jgi:hypothetical protein
MEAHEITLLSVCVSVCLSIYLCFPYVFGFLCGSCRIKGKALLSFSNNFFCLIWDYLSYCLSVCLCAHLIFEAYEIALLSVCRPLSLLGNESSMCAQPFIVFFFCVVLAYYCNRSISYPTHDLGCCNWVGDASLGEPNLSIYLGLGSTSPVDLGRIFSFLIHTQSVGLLGRGIRTSQGRYLHTEQHKHRLNAYTQTSMPRVGEDGSCLRLPGHCYRQAAKYLG